MIAGTTRALRLAALAGAWALASVLGGPSEAHANGTPCHVLDHTTPVPSGFGAPHDVQSGSGELILQAHCIDGSGAAVTVGTGEADHYVYRRAYYWRNGAWREFELTGSTLVGDTWYPGSAQGQLPLSAAELANGDNWFIAYTCTWTANNWRCGCRNNACTQSLWQLQGVEHTTNGGGGGSGGGGTLTGNSPSERQRFAVNPQHPRYFLYKGKPAVLFGRGFERSVATPDNVTQQRIQRVASNANHFYMAVHSTWVRASWQQMYNTIRSDSNWSRVRDACRWAHENDVLLTLIFWSYKYEFTNNGGENWGGSNMIYRDPNGSEANQQVLPGVTKKQIHETAIQKAVEACWRYPNVSYSMMWEYNVRVHDKDPQNNFHRWWADELKKAGRRVDSNAERLIGVAYGGRHPHTLGGHFITEEDGNGFYKSGATPDIVRSYNVPLVMWSADYRYGDFTALAPHHVREIIRDGFHPSQTWVDYSANANQYILQARWYLENNNFNINGVPEYRASSRPRLNNPSGYTNGARHNGGGSYTFAAVYSDPDGDRPALAEVWVDRNNNGVFEANERFTMQASGGDFRNGVQYTSPAISAPVGARYVFRFADVHWYPPVAGGLVPPTWYGDWTLTSQ